MKNLLTKYGEKIYTVPQTKGIQYQSFYNGNMNHGCSKTKHRFMQGKTFDSQSNFVYYAQSFAVKLTEMCLIRKSRGDTQTLLFLLPTQTPM